MRSKEGTDMPPDEQAWTAAQWRLRALSPLDGRYGRQAESYAEIFSENATIRERLAIEVAWLQHLARIPQLEVPGPLSSADNAALASWVTNFGNAQAAEVKQIEARTNHDIKAIEYYLKNRLTGELNWPATRAEMVHFGATSEDVSNLAYARMIRRAVTELWLPDARKLVKQVRRTALQHAELPMLGRTHGQPATPTTLGKELAVFAARWDRQAQAVRQVQIMGKWGGATGTLAAWQVACPELDWITITRRFVESHGLSWAPLTTQIEPHDWIAELFDALRRFNNVLLGFCRDMWTYISLGYLRQAAAPDEVGSSTMPHKINPIDFENAEANVGLANALLGHLADKLPVSRLQRDLSDSSAMRNIGMAFGYCGLALASATRGFSKITPDPAALAADLEDEWEVLAEAVQTVMRRWGISEPYEQLKAITRGRRASQDDIRQLVGQLQLPAGPRQRLLEMTPATYVGLAAELTRQAPRTPAR